MAKKEFKVDELLEAKEQWERLGERTLDEVDALKKLSGVVSSLSLDSVDGLKETVDDAKARIQPIVMDLFGWVSSGLMPVGTKKSAKKASKKSGKKASKKSSKKGAKRGRPVGSKSKLKLTAVEKKYRNENWKALGFSTNRGTINADDYKKLKVAMAKNKKK